MMKAHACANSRTSPRRLSQRDTSFHDILDDTRKQLACAYVQQATHSITEVAFMLGFTDTSNFARAFKRWTGVAPSEFRRKSLTG